MRGETSAAYIRENAASQPESNETNIITIGGKKHFVGDEVELNGEIYVIGGESMGGRPQLLTREEYRAGDAGDMRKGHYPTKKEINYITPHVSVEDVTKHATLLETPPPMPPITRLDALYKKQPEIYKQMQQLAKSGASRDEIEKLQKKYDGIQKEIKHIQESLATDVTEHATLLESPPPVPEFDAETEEWMARGEEHAQEDQENQRLEDELREKTALRRKIEAIGDGLNRTFNKAEKAIYGGRDVTSSSLLDDALNQETQTISEQIDAIMDSLKHAGVKFKTSGEPTFFGGRKIKKNPELLKAWTTYQELLRQENTQKMAEHPAGKPAEGLYYGDEDISSEIGENDIPEKTYPEITDDGTKEDSRIKESTPIKTSQSIISDQKAWGQTVPGNETKMVYKTDAEKSLSELIVNAEQELVNQGISFKRDGQLSLMSKLKLKMNASAREAWENYNDLLRQENTQKMAEHPAGKPAEGLYYGDEDISSEIGENNIPKKTYPDVTDNKIERGWFQK